MSIDLRRRRADLAQHRRQLAAMIAAVIHECCSICQIGVDPGAAAEQRVVDHPRDARIVESVKEGACLRFVIDSTAAAPPTTSGKRSRGGGAVGDVPCQR